LVRRNFYFEIVINTRTGTGRAQREGLNGGGKWIRTVGTGF
jgi:hypothetical protein